MIKNIFQPDKRPFYRRFALGLVAGLLMIVWPGLAQANGGTTLWVEKVDPYEIIVTASPFPLEAGATNDISVLVGRLSDAQIVLDVRVSLTAEPFDRPGDRQTFVVTHDNATNKLYYAANVVFPSPGRWKLTVWVDGPEGSVSTAFETVVEQQQSFGLLGYLGLAGGAFAAIAFLFFVLNRRAGKAFDNYPEGKDQ